MNECYMIVYHADINSPTGSVELPCYPDEISESQSATWNTQSILGRSSPLIAYTGTEFRSVSINFDMHREMERNNTVEQAITLMRKATYPQYQETGLIPPTIILAFGEFMLRGILRDYSITWKKPIIDGAYQVCSVSMQLYDIPSSVFGANNIRSIPTNPFGVSDPRVQRWW